MMRDGEHDSYEAMRGGGLPSEGLLADETRLSDDPSNGDDLEDTTNNASLPAAVRRSNFSTSQFSSLPLRKKVYLVVSGDATHTDADATFRRLGPTMFLSKAFEWFIIFMICSCIVLVIVQSDSSIAESTGFKVVYELWNWVALIVFTAEYYLRIWSCVENPALKPHDGSVSDLQARIRWARKPMSLLDLVCTVSFYIDLFMDLANLGKSFTAVRSFRAMRILLVVARMERQYKAFKRLRKVLSNRMSELWLVTFIAAVVLVASSILVFYFEHDTQPDVFSSIFVSMYWASITMTTVGYGDMAPKTHAGRFLGSMLGLMGIALFAIPAGLIGSGFTELMDETRSKKRQLGSSRRGGGFSSPALRSAPPSTPRTPGQLQLQLQSVDDGRTTFSSAFDVNDPSHLAIAREILFRGGASVLPESLARRFKLDAGLDGFSRRNPSVPLGLQLSVALTLARTLLNERLGDSGVGAQSDED